MNSMTHATLVNTLLLLLLRLTSVSPVTAVGEAAEEQTDEDETTVALQCAFVWMVPLPLVASVIPRLLSWLSPLVTMWSATSQGKVIGR